MEYNKFSHSRQRPDTANGAGSCALHLMVAAKASENYKAFCKTAACMLGRIACVRQRNFLTRSNSIRLRYLMVPFAALMLTGNLYVDKGLQEPTAIRHTQNALVAKHSQTNQLAVAGRYDNKGARLNVVPLFDESEDTADAGVISAAYTAQDEVEDYSSPKEKEITIDKGDTLAAVLQEAGLSGNETFSAVSAMQKHLDPRKVKPGQSIYLRFDPTEECSFQFAQMRVEIDPVRSVVVEPSESGFVSEVKEKEVHVRVQAQRAKIETSLFGSAIKAGIPSRVVAETIRIFSWDVDFQRDIREGDMIEVLYETYVTEDGDFARYGNVLFANLSVGGKPIPVFRFETKDGDADYFEPNGHSVRKALMKTPIDGARISSGFGMRKHPILGYNKMHKGQDFAAPSGTPIYAAGDGTIEKADFWNAYGNYVRIRHNSGLKTAYAHMSRFGKGISPGKRVKQGDVIGYVGTTGRSTGPHLHYEVLVDGAQVNPSSLKLAQGSILKGAELDRFKKVMESMQAQYRSMTGGVQLVRN